MKTITSCIDHVSMRWELIVVDNGSIDGSKDAVVNLCTNNNVDLHYLVMNHNLGVAGARNVGYQQASGEIVYFIDDDAYITSNGYCLDKIYKYMMEKPSLMITSNKIYDTLMGGILPEICEKNKKMENGTNLRSFIGASHFIKKSAMLPNNLYPDNLFYGGEEYYLSFIVHSLEKRIEYCDYVSVYHEPSKKTRDSHYGIYRNRILNSFIVKKYLYPQPYLTLTTLCYWFRALKFTHCSPRKLHEMHQLYQQRYDKKYKKTISFSKMKEIVNEFGYRYLL